MVQMPGQEGPRSTDAEESSNAAPNPETPVVQSPPPGQEVALQVGDTPRFQLRFDPTDIQVAAVEGDLLLQFPNGGQVALRDFSGAERNAPELILPDGTPLDGEAIVEQLEQLGSRPPLETAADPQSGSGGGASSYQSNLGSIIAGLRPAGGAGDFDPDENVSIPGAGAVPPADTGDEALLTLAEPPAAQPAAVQAVFVPPANPVGPGADQPLFTNKADTVDLNAIDVGGYQEGTQYDAGRGNDTVILAEDSRQALEAGFAEGTLFDAGRGHDLVTGGSLADLVDGGRNNDTLFGNGGDDSLFGGSGHDSLLGGEDNDQLFGAGGRDTLDGGAGADLLDGGSSNDILLGGQGDDTLDGGSGRDTLQGGLGDDVITGGSGRDVFSFSLAENQGDDVILDFRSGNGGDRLELADLLDENGDSSIDIADLDAGGHSVSGSADAVVITFAQGGSLTLSGLDGSGVDSFADLVDMKVNVDIS